MKRIKDMLKKLFIPGYTDKKVEAIHAETEQAIMAAHKTAKRYNALLKKNGVTMQIIIAAGGEHGHN